MAQEALETAIHHHQAGRLVQAEALYRLILSQHPRFAEAHYNLGRLLKSDRRPEEAMESFRRAIALRGDFPEAHNNLGNVLRESNRPAEAIDAYRQALSLRPEFTQAWNNLAAALKDVGQLEEALACFDRAAALEPDNTAVQSNRLCTLYFHPDYDAAAILAEHRNWGQRHALSTPSPGEGWGEGEGEFELEPAINPRNDPHPNPLPEYREREPESPRRLRIGYVSPYFRRHCQTHFTTPLFSHHDHRQFEIFCYSDVAVPDALTDQLRSLADVWRDISRLPDAKVAEMIRVDGIDILVDLTLHMAGNRLGVFAQKPAPIQVTWLGYPGTTGLEAIDYRLTDPYLDPPGQDDGECYCERSIRLPHSFWCYDPHALEPTPAPGPLPAQAQNQFTFGSLNNFCKATDRTLNLWARVLEAVPRSRLLMLAPPGPHRQRVLDVLARGGIDAARVELIEFQPRGKYLETYRRIDLGLDTLPYNGHTTSLDSLWMGVPVLTLLGRTAVGRAGWSQLCNLGLSEFAARDEEEFVRLAVHWSANLPALGELRSTLRQRMSRSPLMDAPRFAANLESIYRKMWQRWRQTQAKSI